MDELQHKRALEALRAKQRAQGASYVRKNAKGIGPNKAAGRKGGIRRQGSK